jgi:hypothetical protein
MEWSAIIAGLHIAARSGGSSLTVIVVDSKFVYDHMTKSSHVVKKDHLKPLAATARELYGTIAGNVILCHMWRENINPADRYVKEARAKAAGVGDQSIWPALPTVKTKRPRNTDTMAEVGEDNDVGEYVSEVGITTYDEYLRIYRCKARTKCPDVILPGWASIVKKQLTRVISSTGATRDCAMLVFMLLPNLFLPQREAISKAKAAVMSQTPSAGALKSIAASKATPVAGGDDQITGQQRTKRAIDAVERLARDMKVKSAMKIYASLASADKADRPFHDKVEALKALYVEEEARVDDETHDVVKKKLKSSIYLFIDIYLFIYLFIY